MEYIRQEFLILIPVLMGLGKTFKSAGINKRFIPLILTIIGAALASVYMLIFVADEPLGQAIFTGFIQGVLAALVATGVHQHGKQILNHFNKEDKS
jgi:peptidoglycan/LPS O-acetylase OafA/YrhL